MSGVDSSSGPNGLSSEQVRLVQNHLEEILSERRLRRKQRSRDFSPTDCRARFSRAIRFSLKERAIGAEMFGRPIG